MSLSKRLAELPKTSKIRKEGEIFLKELPRIQEEQLKLFREEQLKNKKQ